MAPKKPTPKAAAPRQQQQPQQSQRQAPPAPAVRNVSNTPDWDAALNALKSQGSGPFFFLKAPKTRLRLVCLNEDVTAFYAGAQTFFRNKPKTKYVVFGQVISADGKEGGLDPKWQKKVVPIVITKTVLTGIIALLAEGYELFDEQEGFGLTITKTGSGTDTDYNVLPSPSMIPLSAEEWPEKELEEYAAELTARGEERQNNEAQGNGNSGGSRRSNNTPTESGW